jgi:hypothetical protein
MLFWRPQEGLQHPLGRLIMLEIEKGLWPESVVADASEWREGKFMFWRMKLVSDNDRPGVKIVDGMEYVK